MHDANLLEDQPIAWTPTPDVIERSQLTRFMRQVGVTTWDELYEYSIRDVEKFTEEVLKFLDIKFDPPYSRLLDTSGGIEFPKWFLSVSPAVAGGSAANAERGTRNAESVSETRRQESEPGAVATGPPLDSQSPLTTHRSSLTAGLNITTVCLDRWQTDEMKDQPAIIWEGEEGGCRTWSYADVLRSVEELDGELREYGVEPGDAVGIHLPMLPDTVVSLLAINRMGAIAVPVFSGYGVEAIASRMNAVAAKCLITCDGFPRRGKWFDMGSIATEAIARVPTIEAVIRIKRKTEDLDLDAAYGEIADTNIVMCGGIPDPDEKIDIFSNPHDDPLPRTSGWSATLDCKRLYFRTPPQPTSAEDPLIILYTSGTTGKPKGIAHTHASFPIKAAQDMAFGTDVGRGTRICWYTDIGWMMGPWLIYGALINGATICLYDGAPDYPTPDRMWEFCAKHKVEVLGISPTLVRALAAHEESSQQESVPPAVAGGSHTEDGFPQSRKDAKKPPFERHDLSSLRAFASTGEPWNPAPWWWLFEKVGNSKLPIINYSGGTEIAGGILMGNPLLPIKPCSFPAPCPGMDVDILDEHGQPVQAGQVGELVIKQPWIGMARGFWQEKDRYLETYWSRFKNIWVHGDWAMRDKDGHWFILGRSDDTLKVAGKRVGPAEVESLLVAHPLVTEAAVIGVPDEKKGTAMVAFCVLSHSPSGSVSSVHSVVHTSDKDRTTETTEDTERRGLETELRSLVAKDMGKPLAPSKIHFVSALPKTRNAKVMRRVIRAAYLGEDPGDLSALENPNAVDELKDLGDIGQR